MNRPIKIFKSPSLSGVFSYTFEKTQKAIKKGEATAKAIEPTIASTITMMIGTAITTKIAIPMTGKTVPQNPSQHSLQQSLLLDELEVQASVPELPSFRDVYP